MRWASSTNGPDWIDVRAMMMAIMSTHESTTWLDIQPSGSRDGTTWRITVCSIWPALLGRGRYPKVVNQVEWPNPNSKTFEGAVLSLLYTHDGDIARTYTQSELLPPA